MTARFLRCTAAIAFAGAALAAHAGDGDMRVLTDEITARGDVGVDLQFAASRKPRDAALEGRDAMRGLLEVSYGIADDWEASVQLPVARSAGRSVMQGANLELQVVAPHDAQQGGYVGLRVELGYAADLGEKRSWKSEWKPILGWRSGRWHGVLNLGVTVPITGDDRRLTFEPTLRVVRAVSGRSALGFELQSDLGPAGSARADRHETLLAVFDTRWHKIDVTIGLGKGLNARSDGLTGKLLAEFELED